MLTKTINFMSLENVRWKHRFQSFSRALLQLKRFIDKGDSLNDLEEQGMVKAFEYTYEMAWLTMKDFYDPDTDLEITCARDAFLYAARFENIHDSNCWTDMQRDRNRTVHVYNYGQICRVAKNIRERYYPAMVYFKEKMDQLKVKEKSKLNNIK